MKIVSIIFLPLLLSSLVSFSMDPVGQRIEVNQRYVETILEIGKQTKHNPVHMQAEINNLMQADKTWKTLLSHPFFAGGIVEQISERNQSELFPVAIMLNTPGTVQWLKKYIASKPKKQIAVKDFIALIKNHKLKKQNKITSQEYAPFLATLNEIEDYINSLHTPK